MKLYLSGPMTGRPQWNYPEFNQAAEDLRREGYEVFNPAEAFDGNTTLNWSTYLRKDIQELLNCDAVAVLDGWQDSVGACLEVTIAAALGIEVWEFDSPYLVDTIDFGDPRQFVHEIFFHPQSVDKSPEKKPDLKVAADPRTDSVLVEAAELVHGDRQQDYGHPLDDFSKTAKIWEAILGTAVTPEQVALCMVGVKISRQVNAPKRDNLVDGAGYFETLNMVIQERTRRQ